MRVRIYCRVSTEEQNLVAQFRECRAYCARQGYTVVGVYWDRGDSRDSPLTSRPGFSRLSEHIESGEIIVVYHRDRLGEGIALAVLEKDLERIGVHVESTKGAGNGRTVEDALIRRILDAVSEYEHSRIRLRILDTLRNLKAQGRAYCGRLYGYSNAEGRFVKSRDEQRVLDFIAALKSKGKGPHQIAQELTLRGYTAPRGGRIWSHSSVRKIMERV